MEARVRRWWRWWRASPGRSSLVLWGVAGVLLGGSWLADRAGLGDLAVLCFLLVVPAVVGARLCAHADPPTEGGLS